MGFGGGPTFITFHSKIIEINCAVEIVWFWLILCKIFYTYHCTLTLFSWQHFIIFYHSMLSLSLVYYFVIMTYFWTMIIFSIIDLLVNCHVCFTLFSRDPFFRNLEECYSVYCTFLISNMIHEPRLRFFIDNFFN